MSLTERLTEASIPFSLHQPLALCTSFRIGGPADVLIHPRNADELTRTLDICRTAEEGQPLCVLGNGSNVLFSDKGFHGVVILTGGVDDVSFRDDGLSPAQITAGCGTSLTGLASACVQRERHLTGLEFAFGIPGSLGGAVVMNAGAYGGEMCRVVTSSQCYDLYTGQTRTIRGEEHDFAYRHSIYADAPHLVVLSATLTLPQGDPEVIRATMKQHATARREKQPLEYPSAGSIFKRPALPGVYVGKLVEECGLKGYRIGDAQVSERHAGFIVNRDHATAAEVVALIRHIQETIRRAYQIDLACEVRAMDENGAPVL